MTDKLYFSMPDKEDIIILAVKECLNTLFSNSIPSITYEDYIKLNEEEISKFGKEYVQKNPTYERYFCPQDVQKDIIEHYAHIYNLDQKWKDYVNIVIRDLKEGGYTDCYKKDSLGHDYRTSKRTQKLNEIVDQETSDKIISLIETNRDFYRFEREYEKFSFNAYNYSPTTNEKTTIKYWQTHGKPDFNITEEDIQKKYYDEPDDDELTDEE